MIVGIPREIKPDEYRVAIVPAGVDRLVKLGHSVFIEAGAGVGSGIEDAAYKAAGATIAATRRDVFERAGMILKVKEPLGDELPLIREGQIVFTYFHFAASRELTDAMVGRGGICIAYETIERSNGSLPLLIPMSEVAGRMSIQEGAKFL